MIKVGCCGFPVGRGEYFRRFKLVEVQQTFYHPPKTETLQKWLKEAPEDFEFTLKAWQLITHSPSSPTYRRTRLDIPKESKQYGYFRQTPETAHAWDVTCQCAHALRAKIIVFQCPASFDESDEHIENLRRFFKMLPRQGFTFVWEPRGRWKAETIQRLCEELGLIHCVDLFETKPLYGSMRYFRLHGGPGYRHRYTTEELTILKNLVVSAHECYILFNNISMFEDASKFLHLL